MFLKLKLLSFPEVFNFAKIICYKISKPTHFSLFSEAESFVFFFTEMLYYKIENKSHPRHMNLL